MSWAWLDSTESWIQTCRSMGVFFPPPIVCRVPCWELQPLESYGTVISQGTELIRWTASTQEGSRQANLPAREQTARGKPFPHALQPKDSRPHDPSSSKLPAPHTVSPGSVLLARKQLQGQDLKARAICISMSAWLPLGHLSNHESFASYWGKQVLAMPAGGTSWSQRWPWVFP